MKTALLACALLLTASPAFAQFGKAMEKINKAADQAQKVKDDWTISDADERQIGEAVSAKLLDKYGVYQDKDVAKYVTLLGTVLAQASPRPGLKWEFVVLDTDGVNAFAAPGGIIHVTRGALGLAKTEAELAGVLGHEITHVTEKHTTKSIQKSKVISVGADQAGKGSLTRDVIAQIAQRAYESILNNSFDRGDENEADRLGVQLANKAGYDAKGLGSLLTKIAVRNKDQQEANGMFASHPVIADRIVKINATIAEQKLTATAEGAARYTKSITFDAKPLASIATGGEGAKGLAGSSDSSSAKKDDADKEKKDEKKDEKKKGGLLGSGLSLSKGSEKQSTQTTASAGARGGVPDRDAVGGPNKTKIAVTVTDADVAAFKKGIA
jgi:predicted Zn-dependent protease